jgi:glycosyltransferase involved in cell wall biosynthesis
MNSYPLVSIVIPVYNRVSLIKESVESALKQTYHNIECIIIDNKSTDGTFELLKTEYSTNDKVILYQNNENMGPVRNWISGIKISNGEYIKLLFSDDWLEPNDIEDNLKYLVNDLSNGLIYNPAFIHDKNRKGLFYDTYSQSKKINSKLFIYRLLLNNNTPVSPCSAMFRSKDLADTIRIDIPNKKGLDFSKFGAGNDLLIFLDIASKYDFVYFNNTVCINFSGHSGSLTRSNNLRYYYKTARLFYINERFYGIDKLFYSLLVLLPSAKLYSQ